MPTALRQHHHDRTPADIGTPAMLHRLVFSLVLVASLAILQSLGSASLQAGEANDPLVGAFQNPPREARPGVYWYFMDGNLSRDAMTADLESMWEAGLGNLVFLEVNVGVPRGPVDFLSDRWQDLFAHAVREAERVGIEITLGSGPGWAGSGGPWVTPEQSMQHLVASTVQAQGPTTFEGVLPVPKNRAPFFGDNSLTEELRQQREQFYRDVAVLAFPTPSEPYPIADIDEKALYYRAPYSSTPGVKAYLPAFASYPVLAPNAVIDPTKIIELSDRLQPDGSLIWEVPAGPWTIMRFGRRNNGATTRPAPRPGLGFECDKLDAAALDAHFEQYVGKLLRKVGERDKDVGWQMLHIDSWEMGAQNWTAQFRDEFRRRRGYDPLLYLPTYVGSVVNSLELSERFLWDVRLTAQELVLENHAGRFRELGRRYGFGLSIEPYDMNPSSDMELGSVADVPMCEFWSDGFGFETSYSCIEAASIAHTQGRSIVSAEAFTATDQEAWKQYPGSVKNQGDWAFAMGINRLVYHTFAHKPYGDRPGMTMGPYGVHWDRGQTWWPMAGAYHRYVARCQHVLQQGANVADICYLVPEGAPHVFRPPPSALEHHGSLRDRRGYNFDGCSPNTLLAKASVRNGRVVFPGGAEYQLLVLPAFETMTPELLKKISELVEAGATVVGPPPRKSPSLVDYPACDQRVQSLATTLWGDLKTSDEVNLRKVGEGHVVWGGNLQVDPPGSPHVGPIEDAQWIWYPEGEPAVAAPKANRYFRRTLLLDGARTLKSARLEITADNAFQVWVNGQQALTGDNFHVVYSGDVVRLLRGGKNELTIAVENGGDAPNPAGLVAALRVEYGDGTVMQLVTDRHWESAREVDRNWPTAESAERQWTPALELGPLAMNPWRVKVPANDCPDLYPDYEATAALLAGSGVVPDFESDAPVRYTHRRTESRDIYFVANCTGERITTSCTFRIAGRKLELWDPLTGAIRTLPVHSEQEGRTAVPIRFEPYQSFFVVFSEAARALPRSDSPAVNFPEHVIADQINGPWEISFDAQLGGPERARFPELVDWTEHADPRIKYFSGIATYRHTFDSPQGLRGSEGPVLLDLGEVRGMARVRLNGHDLGVVWCAPWHVDITSALQSTGNRLEIDVANLWPNRLIGDQRLPLDRRVAKTNFNPYQADSPLLPSGLTGPVVLKTVRLSDRPGDTSAR